jgi:glycerophosphoryl diester phosphodiesterase
MHDELMPALGVDLKLVALISGEDEDEWMISADGISDIAQYADGIGPSVSLIVDRDSQPGALVISDLVALAHANGMQVHPYTFRLDSGQVPIYANSFEQMLEIFLFEAGVDGVFTDFPDRAVEFLRSR